MRSSAEVSSGDASDYSIVIAILAKVTLIVECEPVIARELLRLLGFVGPCA